MNITGAQSECSNQEPRFSHSRWSAPHQKRPTQNGQSYQQDTDYNILVRGNVT